MSEFGNETIPPATFDFLVASLRFQAEMSLSGMGVGEKEGEGPNLPYARHFIDLLALLSDKTRGNLTLEEQRMLENSITELRFRYIQAFDSETKKNAAGSEEQAQAATAQGGDN